MQPFDLTFIRNCEGGQVNQSLIANISPGPSGVTSGSDVVALCDGDRIKNQIHVIGRETGSSILVPGNGFQVLSDTVAPDPPIIDPASNDFPKTVFTDTFQIRGKVDNSSPIGNATDKPETSGRVVVFYVENGERKVLGGGIIQPNSRFIATVDMTLLKVGQAVTLQMIAVDSLGNERSAGKSFSIEKCSPRVNKPENSGRLKSKRQSLFHTLYQE